jgi:hypothetical protein
MPQRCWKHGTSNNHSFSWTNNASLLDSWILTIVPLGCTTHFMAQKKYIMDVHGFDEDNIVVLMDDGQHPEPTRANMLRAYKDVVAKAEEGDAIFLHYSGHGSKMKDDDSKEEDDGYDEVLVPLDYNDTGMIRDDDLYEILVNNLPQGVHVVSLVRTKLLILTFSFGTSIPHQNRSFNNVDVLVLVPYQMDCCHSGTILDLPYVFQADGDDDGSPPQMLLDANFDWQKIISGPVGKQIMGILRGLLN